jgi:hypothetical protein
MDSRVILTPKNIVVNSFNTLNCRRCVGAKARIFVGKLDGNGGRLGYGDLHGIFQHHYSSKYATTLFGPQS